MLIYVILLVIKFVCPYIVCNIVKITVYLYIIYIYTAYRQLVRKLCVRYYAIYNQLITTEIFDQLVL